MSVPEYTQVLVIGGGPAGSYAASALAREGIEVVVLEGDNFPRYHVGESMLPSLRHFFRFIDLDTTFLNHGFYKKIGAAFVLNNKDPAYTDFLDAGGPEGYSWNVIRSEADNLIFRHAGNSGAEIFDGVRVKEINFEPHGDHDFAGNNPQDLGRPLTATWSRRADGSSGLINFDYLIDASGRMGIMSTKYLKNRRFNEGLKNIALWAYWRGAGTYGTGTPQEGVPYFEALSDGSGWAWFIPLHNDTTSVGLVINHKVATRKKKLLGSPENKVFYHEMLKTVPRFLAPMLSGATVVSEVRSASDWSYSASCYASNNVRIIGDAGCFIDPFFSSGVHLAVSSALSAAATICASVKGQCSEQKAAEWHSKRVAKSYTRFLLVVLTALKQISLPDEAILSSTDEAGFRRAFDHFQSIIQGLSDVNAVGTQEDVSNAIEFSFDAFLAPLEKSKRDDVLKRLEGFTSPGSTSRLQNHLTSEELEILESLRAKTTIAKADIIDLNDFTSDTIDGLALKLVHGDLGLMKPNIKLESIQQDLNAGKQKTSQLK